MVTSGFVSLFACGGNGVPSQMSHQPLYQYTCCQKADIERSWQAGRTFTLHWINQPASGNPIPPSRYVALSAELKGPYLDAASLKNGGGQLRALRAHEIAADTWQPQELVSEIPLPQDLSPGLYDLRFKVAFGGGSMGGASIVRVTPSQP
jgi:hypothetical protein